MQEEHESGLPRRPVAITPEQLVEPPAQQTAGITRRQAFAAGDTWVGFVRNEPGASSGWHHHGDTQTYFYVLRGAIEIEYEAESSVVRFQPGDFAHVPARLIHRERTAPGEASEVVLFRIGPGPTVVNVEGPRADPAISGESGRESVRSTLSPLNPQYSRS